MRIPYKYIRSRFVKYSVFVYAFSSLPSSIYCFAYDYLDDGTEKVLNTGVLIYVTGGPRLFSWAQFDGINDTDNSQFVEGPYLPNGMSMKEACEVAADWIQEQYKLTKKKR